MTDTFSPVAPRSLLECLQEIQKASIVEPDPATIKALGLPTIEPKFKLGQLVVCTDAEPKGLGLTQGGFYYITSVEPWHNHGVFYQIYGDGLKATPKSVFLERRFRAATTEEETMFLRCGS